MATVKCDVCGGIFSQRYLASHKRLAHTKNIAFAGAPITQEEVIQTIASLYESLSVNGRKRVMCLLTAEEQNAQKGEELG
jgi:hypothetical protein